MREAQVSSSTAWPEGGWERLVRWSLIGLVLVLLGAATTGCVSFISDDTTLEPNSVVVEFPVVVLDESGELVLDETGKPIPAGRLIGRDFHFTIDIRNKQGDTENALDAAARIQAMLTKDGTIENAAPTEEIPK